ncbi:MAG: hypothetical protein AAB345_01390 [Patescibacteria group bacterium]
MNILTVALVALMIAGLVWTVICARDIGRFNRKRKDWEKEAKKYRPSRPSS